MPARLALLLCLAALATPAAALGQASPLQSPLPAAPQTQDTTAAPAPSSQNADDAGLSGRAKAAIIGVGAVLLLGIAWLIVHDARSVAPVEDSEERGPRGTISPQRHARARAKAKAARAQRKRNRARR